jgi:hypothetical protein
MIVRDITTRILLLVCVLIANTSREMPMFGTIGKVHIIQIKIGK